MKKYFPHVLFLLLVAGVAFGGAIKTWATGEVLRSADLNSNFAHLHNTMVGGHGARLVDADVSATAAIAHSKMATPALIPRVSGWVAGGAFATACAADPCTTYANTGITSVAWVGTGAYTVNFAARANSQFMVHLTALNAVGFATCQLTGVTVSSASVSCVSHAGGGAHASADTAFSFLLLDND